MGMSADNLRGFALALSSTFFIGSSFIVKKKGLKKAGTYGVRAASGGLSYLQEPLWWVGMITSFIVYSCMAVLLVLILIFKFEKQYGQTHMVIYIGICSLMGSLTVMSIKALGIAIKLTFSEKNQFIYAQTWFFAIVAAVCCLIQLKYVNKALDTFNTAVVSPVYYVMFTLFTIFASMIMFKDWDSQVATQIISEICGFITILSGSLLLHMTKDMSDNVNSEQHMLSETELQNP